MHLHRWDAPEHWGWAAGHHDAQEARHGARTPDTRTAAGAQRNRQQASWGGDTMDVRQQKNKAGGGELVEVRKEWIQESK